METTTAPSRTAWASESVDFDYWPALLGSCHPCGSWTKSWVREDRSKLSAIFWVSAVPGGYASFLTWRMTPCNTVSFSSGTQDLGLPVRNSIADALYDARELAHREYFADWEIQAGLLVSPAEVTMVKTGRTMILEPEINRSTEQPYRLAVRVRSLATGYPG